MKIIVIGILLTLQYGILLAQEVSQKEGNDWKYVCSDGNRSNMIFIRNNYASKSGDEVKFWFEKIKLKKESKTDRVASQRSLVVINCNTKQFETIMIIDYTYDDKIIRKVEIPEEQLVFLDVVPGSVIEKIQESACFVYNN